MELNHQKIYHAKRLARCFNGKNIESFKRCVVLAWLSDVEKTANIFYANHQFVFFVFGIIALSLANRLYKGIRSTNQTYKHQALTEELEQLRKYRDEAKLMYIAGLVESFLRLTAGITLSEVIFYVISQLLFSPPDLSDPFIYFMFLGYYGVLVLGLIRRLHLIQKPEKRIAKLERRLSRFSS